MDDKEKEDFKRRVEEIKAQRKVQPINSRIEVNDPRKRPHGPEKKSDGVELTAQAIQKGAGLVRSGALKAGSGLLSGIKKGVKAVQERNESKAAAADAEIPNAEDAIHAAEPSTGPLTEQSCAHVSPANDTTQQDQPDDVEPYQEPSAEELEVQRIDQLKKEEEQLLEEVAVQEKKVAIHKLVIDREIKKLKKSTKEQKVKAGRTHYIYVCIALAVVVVCAGGFYGWKHFSTSKPVTAMTTSPSPIAALVDPQQEISEAISDALGETDTPVDEPTPEVAEPVQEMVTAPPVSDEVDQPEVAKQAPASIKTSEPKAASQKTIPKKNTKATPKPVQPENKWQEKASDDLDKWSNSIK